MTTRAAEEEGLAADQDVYREAEADDEELTDIQRNSGNAPRSNFTVNTRCLFIAALPAHTISAYTHQMGACITSATQQHFKDQLPADAAEWSFQHLTINARVVDVIDGDTVFVVTRRCAGDLPARFPLRIKGIDAPEMHPRHDSSPLYHAHQRAAAVAKECLRSRLQGQLVRLVFGRRWKDKYGRLLAAVVLRDGDGDAAAWMQRIGAARAYDGRSARLPWTLEELTRVQRAEMELRGASVQ